MPTIKHKKTSAKADVADSALVRPSDWNNNHDINSVGSSVYLGQNATGAGPILELPIVATSGDDFTLWTKAAITAAITAALANAKFFVTGDVIASVAASKVGGWVLCNGQSLMLANGEPNHALFLMLWEFDTPTGKWPVTPSRGSSAEADWLAGKQVPVPDATGCALGMVDPTDSINSLLTFRGIKVGTEKLFLTIPHMPQHDHGWVPREGNSTPSVSAGNVRGGDWEDPSSPTLSKGKARSEPIGGDPAATPAYANPVPVNLTQPTLGVNYFIKL